LMRESQKIKMFLGRILLVEECFTSLPFNKILGYIFF